MWGRKNIDLALKDAELSENQGLKSELGLRVTPIDEGIEEQTKTGSGKATCTVGNPGTMTHLFVAGPPLGMVSGVS